MPKFQNMAVWRQAEALMQPAFIRLVDNLRKQLEQSDWRGDYQEVQVWPEGTTEAVKQQVYQLQHELEQATDHQVVAIERELEQLPTPYPGYQLRLTQDEQEVTVDLWELCYRICFRDYDVASGTSHLPGEETSSVAVDTSLLDETGEVDWHQLDEKTRQMVEQVFANLPG